MATVLATAVWLTPEPVARCSDAAPLVARTAAEAVAEMEATAEASRTAGAAGAAGAAESAETTEARSDWPPPAADLTDADIVAAIEAITASMLADVDPMRGWDPSRWTSSWGSATQSGGYTALAALALVRAGVSPHVEGLDGAIDLVRTADLEGTYAVATRACLLSRLPPDRREGLTEDIDRLLRSLHVETGGWNYRIGETRARRDNSLRQFGALALWDAAAAGIPIPVEAWAIIDGAFIAAQRPDGGWNYTQDDEPSRGSMTAAAVATLMITDEQLAGDGASASASASRRRAIERGLEWLDKRFDASRNPGSRKWFLYYAYSIERVGLAAGLVRLGGEDWFRELARAAIDRACRRRGDGTIEIRRDRRNRVDDLAFTLLLLSRGRVPLLAGKLVVAGAETDARPRDVGRIAHVTGTALESEMGWRRIEARDPVEEWLSVPILACTGSGELPAAGTADGDLLRSRMAEFLDAGGWLLGIDEGDGRFARDLAEMVTQLRPRATTARADRDHAAHGFHRDPGRRLPITVVNDGVRDLAILLRGDEWLAPPAPVRADRGRGAGRRASRSASDRVDPHETVLLNLALAATADVPPGPRLAARPGDPVVAGRAVLGAVPAMAPGRERAAGRPPVLLHRLRHAGYWDAVPGFERSFAAWAEAAGLADVTAGPAVSWSSGRDWPHGGTPASGEAASLLLVTGTAAPTAEEAAAIAEAILAASRAGNRVLLTTAGGGGITAGAAGGGRTFSEAVEAALLAAGAPSPRRSVADAVLSGGPLPVDQVRWTVALTPSMGRRPTPPRVRGTVAGPGAAPILISHEDVLVGALGRGAWGVAGHAPASARRVLAAIAAPSGRMPAAEEPAGADASPR